LSYEVSRRYYLIKMRWLFTIILAALLVLFVSGINYLRRNDLKIFRHPSKEETTEEELIGLREGNDFPHSPDTACAKKFWL